MSGLFPETDSPDADADAPAVTVAVERSIDNAAGGLSYRVPAELGELRPGDRVTVPLGRGDKRTAGIVTAVGRVGDLASDVPAARLKTVRERVGASALLTPELLRLADWIAAYYCCPLGMVLGAVLPAAVKAGTGVARVPIVRAAVDGPPDPADPASPRLTKLQKAVLDHALRAAGETTVDAEHPGWIERDRLLTAAGAKTRGPLDKLAELGLLRTRTIERLPADVLNDAEPAATPARPPAMTAEQQAAFDHLTAHGDAFGTHLLHGVTGSGKTEVYLRVIEHLLERDPGAGAIVMVPEIALTPQTSRRFRERLGRFGVALMHSGLTASQRHAHWRRLADGEARIAVGPRSAVFAPLPRLGLVVVDESHESTYKSEQLPRYHGRDVAIRRAQLAGCPVVLGSATPSIESVVRALGVPTDTRQDADAPPFAAADLEHAPVGAATLSGHAHYLPLRARVPGAEFPEVEILDLTEERRHRRGVHLLSTRMEDRLASTAADGGQSILLLNRRGFANYISCPDHRCGWLLGCDHCDALMTYHRDARLTDGGVVRCHHCLAERRLPRNCPDCNRLVTTFGMGTQRIEDELARKFPKLVTARMDTDTMQSPADYADVLGRFASGEIAILLGTQMIAKGLDVPNVRFVGVVNADTALSLPDFRAAERTYQLIAQVAGRAGRATHRGRVLIQTFNPTDPTIRDAADHDFASFAAREINGRRRTGLPPFGRLTRVVCRDRKRAKAQEAVAVVFKALRAAADELGVDLRIKSPAPCPIARIADHHRFQVEALTPTAAGMQKLLTALRNRGLLISDTHTAVDVDPVSLL